MKRLLITGSTDGIGKIAAMQLAKAGHYVIVHGRSKEKVSNTVHELKRVSINENVSGVVADLSDINQCKIIYDYIKDNDIVLDVIINNAGVFKSPIQKNNDGIDIRLVVNYLSPVYLTELLIPLMETNGDRRIINLSSAAQEPVSLTALKGQRDLSEQSAYAQSKLALLMWSFHLGKKLSDATVIPVNPGSLLNTKMVQEAYGRHWSPATKGSNILVSLATEKEYANVTGKYFDNDLGNPVGGFGSTHVDATNENKIAELMDVTHQLIKRLSQ